MAFSLQRALGQLRELRSEIHGWRRTMRVCSAMHVHCTPSRDFFCALSVSPFLVPKALQQNTRKAPVYTPASIL